MKQIQEWLGHSDFNTNANIYVHLAFDSKISSATALSVGTAFGRMQQNDQTEELPPVAVSAERKKQPRISNALKKVVP